MRVVLFPYMKPKMEDKKSNFNKANIKKNANIMSINYKDIFKWALIIFLFIGNITLYAQFAPVSDLTTTTSTIAKESKKSKDTIKDAKKGSFLPVPFFVTDQNIGFGLILALAYMHPNKRESRKNTPPSITAVFGGGTSKKTWTIGGAHTHSWNNDKLRYAGAILYVNLNLDFYQLGSLDLSDNPIEVNLNGWGAINHILFRLGEKNVFVGPQYSYASIESSLNFNNPDTPILDSIAKAIDKTTTFSALGLLAHHDSRDNTISPNKGIYSGFKLNYNANWLGATDQFAEINLFFKAYIPINKWLYSIYHFDYKMVGGDAPFYLKPYVQLRGVPALYYQGDMAAKVENQWRALFYKNWAVVGFIGAGKAFDSFSDFPDSQLIYNYGTGLRYVMKKAFNTRVGIDVAWANPNSQFGWYIVVGTSF